MDDIAPLLMLPVGLGLKVEYANPLANVTVRDGALAGHSMDDIAPLLMLPVGLGLRQA